MVFHQHTKICILYFRKFFIFENSLWCNYTYFKNLSGNKEIFQEIVWRYWCLALSLGQCTVQFPTCNSALLYHPPQAHSSFSQPHTDLGIQLLLVALELNLGFLGQKTHRAFRPLMLPRSWDSFMLKKLASLPPPLWALPKGLWGFLLVPGDGGENNLSNIYRQVNRHSFIYIMFNVLSITLLQTLL